MEASFGNRDAIDIAVIVLPHPELPITPKILPRLMDKLSLLSTGFIPSVLEGKQRLKSLISIMLTLFEEDLFNGASSRGTNSNALRNEVQA